MTDWRQIQARIRKAKTSSDPLTKLSELYQRTRDAMVAWELGAVEEKGGRLEQAAKWYTAAAQRFRRSEWKKKAEEALARLGIEIPADSSSQPASISAEEAAAETAAQTHEPSRPFLALGEVEMGASGDEVLRDETSSSATDEFPSTVSDAEHSSTTAGAPVDSAEGQPGGRKKRRRGRRGGRGRHRKPGAAAPGLPAQAFTPPPSGTSGRTRPESAARPAARSSADELYPEAEQPPRPIREEPAEFERSAPASHAPPQLPSERVAHGRAGDFALASRMAHLESMLRRLLSSPLHRLDELEEAPAGPGVFLLSDSDQVTSYYIEACQTLRIGLGNLVRGNRGGKSRRPASRYPEAGDLKEKLADHLGISQSKVSQYMKDHCVVRWIQLDDDAPHLAHFAIGILRTPLNLD